MANIKANTYLDKDNNNTINIVTELYVVNQLEPFSTVTENFAGLISKNNRDNILNKISLLINKLESM